jgi:hypothetical protein
MSLAAYTLVHVIISLGGIVSGLAVLFGLILNKRLEMMTALFLAATLLTSITGFLFPFEKVTPGIIVGVLSCVVLAFAIVARYPKKMAGSWRRTYVISAGIALWFNLFVLVVQSFEKIPALHALAPTGKEPPFAIAQLVVLTVMIVLTVTAAKRFRDQPLAAAKVAH